MRHYAYFDKSGKLQCESFRLALAAMKSKGEANGKPVDIVITLEELRNKRSSRANRYYWGVVVDLIARGLKDLGWEPSKCRAEEVHEMLKREFLTVDEHVRDGLFLRRTRSTKELDTKEFQEYLEHCCRFSAENLGVVIPPPGEQLEIEEQPQPTEKAA